MTSRIVGFGRVKVRLSHTHLRTYMYFELLLRLGEEKKGYARLREKRTGRT